MTAPSKELHFFPGAKQLLWIEQGKVALRAEAWGGEVPRPGVQYPVMPPRPTTPGKYIIHSYEPYRTKTWAMSQIAWGTPIAKGPNDSVLYAATPGQAPSKVLADKGKPVPASEIENEYLRVFGKQGFPHTWVFNDFGPWSVRYFRDKNANRRLDKGEHLSGEMIHTTPDNEAETAAGGPVNLFDSHGCIHIKPLDRDVFQRRGAFATGNFLTIHSYKSELAACVALAGWLDRRWLGSVRCGDILRYWDAR